ncbi:MAG: methyltransferase domain-containing protein [Acidobacteria bacterium]|nr:methyltransferase domain-containing protein [Acidobacteriota bacterium]MBV9483066.1 methyltransferase domain-containing protein [Acidobacteriota bacterium]
MPTSDIKTDEVRLVEYWSRIAPDFDAIYTGNKNPVSRALDRWLRKDIYERYAWVMRKAEEIKPASVCDVGCGSGRFVASLAKRGARVTGVDFAPDMLKLARQLTTSEGVSDRCEFVLSDILDWKTSDRFDMVIAIGFWDYVRDPIPRLEVIRNLTKRSFLSAWPRAGTVRMRIRNVRLKMAGCPVYFFHRNQIEEYLRRVGFRVESSEILGQLYCIQATPV